MIVPKKETKYSDDFTGVVAQFLSIFHRLKNQIPYSIREMLRIIKEKASFLTKDLSKHLFMLSELLWGCWLSTGMRVPEIFGLLPYRR